MWFNRNPDSAADNFTIVCFNYSSSKILIYLLTILESVSGNKYANNGPLRRFKWKRNTAVDVFVGDAASKYI